jgi:hypothetical protein
MKKPGPAANGNRPETFHDENHTRIFTAIPLFKSRQYAAALRASISSPREHQNMRRLLYPFCTARESPSSVPTLLFVGSSAQRDGDGASRFSAARTFELMAGYIPLYSSLTTGTLCGRWPDVGLWPIVLSLSDRNGIVDVTQLYIANVTGLRVDEVTACMQRFCQPDPYSRSGAAGGARLTLLDDHRDWGWQIVNHTAYREKARKQMHDVERATSGQNAERLKAKRAATRDDPTRPAITRADPLSDSDSDSDSNIRTKRAKIAGSKVPKELIAQIEDAWDRICPNLPRIKGWPPHRRAALNARIRERCAEGKAADKVPWWEEFFESVRDSDFLSGRTDKPFCGTSIDWLLGPQNFQKVIEDNFANRAPLNG